MRIATMSMGPRAVGPTRLTADGTTQVFVVQDGVLSGTLYVCTYDLATSAKRVIDSLEYEGVADRRAARAMADGCRDSYAALA